jgi:hypothetical protein
MRERLKAAEVLLYSIGRRGLTEPGRLPPGLMRIVETHERGYDRLEPNLFLALSALCVYASPPAEQSDVFLSLLGKRDPHPIDQALALAFNARWAYRWMDSNGPVRVAEAVVRTLEYALARKAKTFEFDRTGSSLYLALKELTPERLPPRGLLEPDSPPPEERWNARTLAAWRDWLERFRELPVFAPAR